MIGMLHKLYIYIVIRSNHDVLQDYEVRYIPDQLLVPTSICTPHKERKD